MRADRHSTLTLVGGGPVGSLLACFLARRGHRVQVLERRGDMRRGKIAAGRSINLAVSARGLHALRQLGLEEEVLRQAVPMRGRMMHAQDGKLTFQRYGRDDSECINSVSRGELNKLLMTHAESLGNVQFRFHQRVTDVDLERGVLSLHDEQTGRSDQLSATRIIGTDGSASVVRTKIIAHEKGRCSEERLDYGYKELTMPPAPGGGFHLEKNALHIWPRGNHMLIALPNIDGSFTCTLFLPHEGPLSFGSLREPAQVSRLFAEQFADVVPLIPDLEKTFFENPTGHMVTVKCSPWSYQDRTLLLGDAAHAIVPFFGQGMNAGFEDCAILDQLLSQGKHLEEIFGGFGSLRRQDTDAIADMAVENFTEMRDKVGDPRFLLEKAVEKVLQEKFPEQYVSRYSLVTFRREPYRLALEAGVVQAHILSELCAGIEAPDQVDLSKAEDLIHARLAPLMSTMKGTTHGS